MKKFFVFTALGVIRVSPEGGIPSKNKKPQCPKGKNIAVFHFNLFQKLAT